MGAAVLYLEEAEGGGGFEAGFAGGAWVEEEDVFDLLLEGDVAVAGDYDLEVGVAVGFEEAAGGALGDFDLVGEVDAAALEGEGEFFGVVGFGGLAVVVASDGGDGCDGGELGDDVVFADVAGVEDVVDALEEGRDAWVEVAVGVGDDA